MTSHKVVVRVAACDLGMVAGEARSTEHLSICLLEKALHKAKSSVTRTMIVMKLTGMWRFK